MPLKGQQEFCCCTGCEQGPRIWAEPLVSRQVWKTACCGCVPKYACVTVEKNGSIGGGMFKLHCPPSPVDPPTAQPLYTGPNISVDGETFDLEFHFSVDDEYNCLFCVRSTDLGWAGDYNCVVIDASARAMNWCRTLHYYELPYTEFIIGEYTVKIVAADHMTVSGRLPCVDADGNIQLDDDPIRDACCNCSCVCRCMCMTVSQEGEPSTTSIGCYYEGSWIFDNGITVSLAAGANNRTCRLRLNVGPGYDVAIDPITNPCPRLEAQWNIIVDGDTLQFDMACLGCAGTCSVSVATCCPSGRTEYPITLYADVTASCAGCPVQSVAMVWDKSISQWVGNYSMCSGHAAQLSIGCPFTSLTFSGNPCVSTSDTDSGATCDPVLASFSLTTGGINCCPGQLGGAVTIGVVVHE